MGFIKQDKNHKIKKLSCAHGHMHAHAHAHTQNKASRAVKYHTMHTIHFGKEHYHCIENENESGNINILPAVCPSLQTP